MPRKFENMNFAESQELLEGRNKFQAKGIWQCITLTPKNTQNMESAEKSRWRTLNYFYLSRKNIKTFFQES